MIAAMAVCLVILVVYQAWDRSRTDSQAPAIYIEEGMLTVSSADSDAVLLQGVTAVDETDGDVTESIVIESVGTISEDAQVTVIYAAFDAAGNVAKASRTVQYADYTPPRFISDEALAFGYGTNFDIMDHVGAVDQRDGDISHWVKVTSLSSGFLSDPGIYDVKLQVTNSLGDLEELIVPVEIYPAGTYNSELTLTDYLIYLSAGETFVAEDYLDAFVFYINTVDLTKGVPADYVVHTSGTVDTNTPGVYAVSYTVSYAQGYQVYTGYSKLIVVVEG